MKTRLIEVIETYERRGEGTEESPIRLIHQFFTKEGELLFEKDCWREYED